MASNSFYKKYLNTPPPASVLQSWTFDQITTYLANSGDTDTIVNGRVKVVSGATSEAVSKIPPTESQYIAWVTNQPFGNYNVPQHNPYNHNETGISSQFLTSSQAKNDLISYAGMPNGGSAPPWWNQLSRSAPATQLLAWKLLQNPDVKSALPSGNYGIPAPGGGTLPIFEYGTITNPSQPLNLARLAAFQNANEMVAYARQNGATSETAGNLDQGLLQNSQLLYQLYSPLKQAQETPQFQQYWNQHGFNEVWNSATNAPRVTSNGSSNAYSNTGTFASPNAQALRNLAGNKNTFQGAQGLQGTTGSQGLQGTTNRPSTTRTTTVPPTTPTTTIPPTTTTTVPPAGVQGVQGNQGRLPRGTQGTQGAQGVNTNAGTVLGGLGGFFGVQGVQGVQGLQGSTTVTVHVPADVLKRAGVNASQFTGTPAALASLVAGNPTLRNYFENRAANKGTTLISSTGRFETTDLEGVFKSLANDPSTNLDGALGQLASSRTRSTTVHPQATNNPSLVGAQASNEATLEAATINATAAEKSSAANALETFFANYGIDSTRVPKNLLDGFTQQFSNMVYGQGIVPTSETAKEMFQSYDGGKLYEAAFPGLTAYNNSPSGKVAPMTMSQYATYRTQFKNLASTYNLPPGFLSDATLSKLIAHGVSMSEVTDRIVKGYQAYQDASPDEKRLLAQQYGITPGQAVAYFLDPSANKQNSLQAIKEAMTAAPLELKGQQVGLQGFGKQQAEQLAGLVRSGALGAPTAAGTPYDFTQAYTAETQAARDAILTQRQMNQAPGTKLDTNTLLASQVAGYTGSPNVVQGQTQVSAQRQVQTAEQAALAPFEAGGGYAETQKGVIGAGSAQQ